MQPSSGAIFGEEYNQAFKSKMKSTTKHLGIFHIFVMIDLKAKYVQKSFAQKGSSVRSRRCPATVFGSDSKQQLSLPARRWEGSRRLLCLEQLSMIPIACIMNNFSGKN